MSHYKMMAGGHLLQCVNMTSDDVMYVTLPLYHISALLFGLSNVIRTGEGALLRRDCLFRGLLFGGSASMGPFPNPGSHSGFVPVPSIYFKTQGMKTDALGLGFGRKSSP